MTEQQNINAIDFSPRNDYQTLLLMLKIHANVEVM